MRKDLKEFFQAGSIYSIGIFAERAVQLLYLPIVTAAFTPSEYGVVALGVVSAQLATRLMTPFNSALTRFYYYPAFAEARKTFVWNLFLIMIIKVLAVAGIFFFVAPALAKLLSSGKSETIFFFRMFSLVILMQSPVSFILGLLRLQQRPILFVSASLLRAAISLIVIAILCFVADLGISAVPLATASGLLAAFVVMLPFFLHAVECSINFRICQEPLAYGYPLIVSAYSNNALQSGDRFILRIFCPLTLVGIYDVGYRIAAVVNFLVGMPAKHALQPIAFKKEKSPDSQRQFLRRLATVYYCFALFVGLGISLFAKEILMLVARNHTYWSAATIIPLLVFGYVQHGLGQFTGMGLGMCRKAFLQSGILVSVALLNLMLNFLLIPSLGLYGAAIATMAAYIGWNVLKGYFSWRYYGLSFEYSRLLVFSILWWLLLGIGFCLIEKVTVASIAAKTALLLSFPIILFTCGFLKKDEKRYLGEVFAKVRSALLSRSSGN